MSRQATIRLVLADDDELVRFGIRAVLSTDPGIQVVAEAADGRAAIELAQRHRPDVVVLDIRMPGTDGITATAEIRRTVPGAAVIVLTTFGEDEYILRALGNGANGFLVKAGRPEDLLAAVRAVVDGAAYLSPTVAARVISHLAASGTATAALHRRDATERVGRLTNRERDVLALLAAGLSNIQIARRLGVVEGTVKAHVSSLLGRLGVANRAAAAVVAYEAGVVPRDA